MRQSTSAPSRRAPTATLKPLPPGSEVKRDAASDSPGSGSRSTSAQQALTKLPRTNRRVAVLVMTRQTPGDSRRGAASEEQRRARRPQSTPGRGSWERCWTNGRPLRDEGGVTRRADRVPHRYGRAALQPARAPVARPHRRGPHRARLDPAGRAHPGRDAGHQPHDGEARLRDPERGRADPRARAARLPHRARGDGPARPGPGPPQRVHRGNARARPHPLVRHPRMRADRGPRHRLDLRPAVEDAPPEARARAARRRRAAVARARLV